MSFSLSKKKYRCFPGTSCSTWVCSQPPCHTMLPLSALLLGEDFAKTQSWSQGFCIFLARLILRNPACLACPVRVGGKKLELGNNPPQPSADRNCPRHPHPTTTPTAPQLTDRSNLWDFQIPPGSLLVSGVSPLSREKTAESGRGREK